MYTIQHLHHFLLAFLKGGEIVIQEKQKILESILCTSKGGAYFGKTLASLGSSSAPLLSMLRHSGPFADFGPHWVASRTHVPGGHDGLLVLCL